MPNYCDYTMKIVGDEKNCQEFLKRMKSYDEPNHFYRIFAADVYEEKNEGAKSEVYINGYCAWSLESCCRESGYSDGVDLFAVNTEELNLQMEAYSREPGLAFEEHYIYKQGNCLVDECRDITPWWWDDSEFPTFEEFQAKYPDAPPKEYFDEGGNAYVGGFGNEYEHWHI